MRGKQGDTVQGVFWEEAGEVRQWLHVKGSVCCLAAESKLGLEAMGRPGREGVGTGVM